MGNYFGRDPYLKVIYEVEGITYQISAEFYYHPDPDPDFFTQVTDLQVRELESLSRSNSA